ncbi:hypothetical protein H2514_07185 [Lysobacter sp. CW239]|uniref:hypothetical protein n=1 Tax=Lysobacteraceae TaxID=32033 RepID=UPI0006916EFA|nr:MULTISPECIES: hypothetical protein [Lysobacter]QOD90044.1 hypothetical protein H2514_07185 [Lysobacter sp. CW239]
MRTDRCSLLLACLLGGAAWPCIAGGPVDAVSRHLGPEWVAVPAGQLDVMRGGFELPSGLVASFGIERLVYVNGALVATASVHIPDIGRMTPEQAQGLAEVKQGMHVQVGGGNTFNPTGAINGLVIQNTLDGQDIRSLTTLDVEVGTLGMFQELNANAALQSALQGAAGSP